MDRQVVVDRGEDAIIRARGMLHDAHEALDSVSLLGELFVRELLYLRERMHRSKKPRAALSAAPARLP